MKNRYLMDRAYRKSNLRRDRGMDRRNPYGSRGGYVVTSRRMGRRDRGMDNGNGYSEYNGGYNRGYDREYSNSDYHYGNEYYGQYNRPMEYEMYGYGVGSMYPQDYRGRGRDYNMDYYSDYRRGRRDYEMDYNDGEEEKEYKEDLEEWVKKLKKHDRFNLPKEEVINFI